MKAIRYRSPGGLDNLELTEMDDPGAPSAHEIRVRMHASSINGHDYYVAMGVLSVEEGRILMTDGAGVVEAIGRDVTEFCVGDRVISTFFPDWSEGEAPNATFARTPGDGLDGYGAEFVVRPADWFTRAPRGWSFAQAATLPTAGLTAWRALVVEGRITPGEDILLLGSGGVSIFALQLARKMGARIIMTSSSDEKLERARELGIAFGVNYLRHKGWGEKVRELTEGRGVDLVVETGGAGTLPESIQATRIGGRIVLIGVLTGTAGSIPTSTLMHRQQRLFGITVGSRRNQVDMVRALETGEIKPIIDSTFPLSRIAEAFERQKKGQHFGKICIEY